jgi:hypothetical protein
MSSHMRIHDMRLQQVARENVCGKGKRLLRRATC